MIQVNGYTETAFRETEFGVVPADWDVVNLSQVASIMMGQSPPSETYNLNEDGLPFFQGKAEFGLIYPKVEKWCSRPLRLAPAGSVLISVRAPVGDVNIAPNACCIGRGLAAIDSFDGRANNFYVFYVLAYHKKRIESEGTGTTFQSINKNVLHRFPIPLPPLSEQRRISAVLNAIQDEIAAQDDIISEAREFKCSLMQQLFTYGAGEQPAETKETEIGEIPGHWEVKQLGDVVQSTQYGLSERAEETGKYPMLRMNSLVDGRIDTRDLKFIDLDENSFKKFRLRPGDILFNRTNSLELVGKTSIFDIADHFVFASYLVRVITKADILLPGYLNFYLNTDQAQARLKMLATRGVSQSNINAAKLRLFKIPVPPSLEEQREIATQLDIVDTKIAAEEDRKAALQDFFKTMLHQLMTGQIRLLSDDGLPL